MTPKHRLHSVVKLRQQEETRALMELADAQRRTTSADEALRGAQARSQREERRLGSATEWQIADSAHLVALREAREAERAARAAAEALVRSRAQFLNARGRVDAVRRVTALRDEGAARELDAREGKQLDELALLRHRRDG